MDFLRAIVSIVKTGNSTQPTEEINMFKKAIAGVLIAALIFTFGMTSIFALDPGQRGRFADRNNDGVFDDLGECPANGEGMRYGGRRGSGGSANCSNYMDADGDGVCDNFGSAEKMQNKTHLRERYFTDADGDGVCDHCDGERPMNGTGQRNGGSIAR